ncbi:hypothetical protein WJX72_001900 [[Myrmecia] bisecta]|uniref:Uncharacterized protein n=1 Tax=[Myrmecia] bisecta TaxID=41462 RepID=A0AAW1R572_9CHLO
MAKHSTEAPVPNPKYSSKLLQMKFMQRGKERQTLTQHTAEQVKKEDDSQWIAAGASSSGCVVISEADPPPGALYGHISFQQFNPAAEKLQAEAEKRREEAKRRQELGPEGAAISDAEMAAAAVAKRKAQEEAPIKGWREGAHKKRQST